MREINLMKDKTLSLSDLLHVFFPETKEMEISSDEYEVLFIFDGLDECRLSLDFKNQQHDLVPSECVHRVTEVRGFNETQKEEYFRKRISDQTTVLEKILSRAETAEIPKTLTQMYTHFLILQTNIKREKEYEEKVTDEDMILKLGKLAFQQLVKGNLIFYDEDLRECGIDVTEASVYSGLCTQIFREELGLFQGKVFCFVHLSLQEHLAALYVHHSFTVNKINAFDEIKQSLLSKILNQMKYNSLLELHQSALEIALKSKNGHLDLFLRFLLGLSVESNQTLLRKLLTQTGSCSYNKEKTVQFIKQKIRENHSSEKSINLFHCLNELGDDSLMQEIQGYLKSGKIREIKLSSSQWSALVYVLLTSEQKMDIFDLKQFIGEQHTGDEVLQYLLPVVKECRSVRGYTHLPVLDTQVYGIPDDVVSDRGTQFTSQYAQNSLNQSSTGLTPFLWFQPPLFLWSGESSSVPAVDDWIRRSEKVWDSAHVRIQQAIRTQEIQANRQHLTHPPYQPVIHPDADPSLEAPEPPPHLDIDGLPLIR
ncbi:protein NLRC3-like [Puntigrus tetrazona]|uniref:protein NLRC3-like n=1 Tax=Puntigrus tetrazona TaxID=1606681 RepID=UPI001C8ADC8E|nr:protein NLRC3-like [Puntigrus tetrazona]